MCRGDVLATYRSTFPQMRLDDHLYPLLISSPLTRTTYHLIDIDDFLRFIHRFHVRSCIYPRTYFYYHRSLLVVLFNLPPIALL